MIRDIIQTAIAVISPDGALDIRECIDDIVSGITFLPEYKHFVTTQKHGEMHAQTMFVACNALSAMILPMSEQLAKINKFLQEIQHDVIKQDMKAIVSLETYYNHCWVALILK